VVHILNYVVEKGARLIISRPSECGADWLTMTWRGEVNDTVLKNKRNVTDWAERRKVKEGGRDFVKPWAWQGYSGMKCGQVEVGDRFDSTIVRLQGKAADDWLNERMPTGHNITRLDIALTFWSDLNRDGLIALHSLEAEGKRNTLQSRPFRVRLIDGKGDGNTLYVGSRSSELWVRIYDKEKSPNTTDEYKGALRYEVELKEDTAREALERCTRGGYSPSACLEVLTSLLDRRGICALGSGGVRGEVFAPSALPITGLEDSLRWLEKQVRPTVSRLMREGYEQEVLEAMGLGGYFNNGY
jgi:DNA relaxase NicK